MSSSSERSIASTGREANASAEAEWTKGSPERRSWLADKLRAIIHTVSRLEEKDINNELLLGTLLTIAVESDSVIGQMAGTAASAMLIGETIRPEFNMPPAHLSVAAGIGHLGIMSLRDSFKHPVSATMAELFLEEALSVAYPEVLSEFLAELVSDESEGSDQSGEPRAGPGTSQSPVSLSPDAMIRWRYRRRREETTRLHAGSVTTLARLQAQSAELAEIERLRGSQQQSKTGAHRKQKLDPAINCTTLERS